MTTFSMKGLFKTQSSLLILTLLWFNLGGASFLEAQQTGASTPTPAPAPASNPVAGDTNAAPGAQANPAPPPSSPPKRSTSDLEKLVAPIALYPDPVIATLLPASAYPLEIVQAARFVKDTNNVAKLDEQPWDSNVKAVARIPQVITQMDENIGWTSDLGDAFINQPKEMMDAIQTMRKKAEDSGALKTTPQQVVNVSQTVVTNVVEQQTVYVTNQVVQIQPAQPNVVYVPQYNPTVVYAGYPVAYPAYTYPAYSPGAMAATSLLSFGAGMAMGAWMANDCDWGGGGCYHSDVDVNRDVNRNVNRNVNRSANSNTAQNRTTNRGQKWQPDQNRLKNSGSTMSSAQSREARGWSSAGQTGAGSAQAQTASARAGTTSGAGFARAGTTGAGSARAGTASQRAQTTQRAQGAQNAQARASTAQTQSRQASTRSANSGLSATGRGSSSQGYNRPSSSSSSSRSAFNSSGSAASTRQSSARGASSRGGGGGFSRGGGGRGGGGGRR